jgi:hypothetical protein
MPVATQLRIDLEVDSDRTQGGTLNGNYLHPPVLGGLPGRYRSDAALAQTQEASAHLRASLEHSVFPGQAAGTGVKMTV